MPVDEAENDGRVGRAEGEVIEDEVAVPEAEGALDMGAVAVPDLDDDAVSEVTALCVGADAKALALACDECVAVLLAVDVAVVEGVAEAVDVADDVAVIVLVCVGARNGPVAAALRLALDEPEGAADRVAVCVDVPEPKLDSVAVLVGVPEPVALPVCVAACEKFAADHVAVEETVEERVSDEDGVELRVAASEGAGGFVGAALNEAREDRVDERLGPVLLEGSDVFDEVVVAVMVLEADSDTADEVTVAEAVALLIALAVLTEEAEGMAECVELDVAEDVAVTVEVAEPVAVADDVRELEADFDDVAVGDGVDV